MTANLERLRWTGSWLPREEIVTGERFQSLAEVSIVPRHVHEFHNHVQRYARELLLVEDHAALSASQMEHLSGRRSFFVYTHELPAFVEHVWPRLTGSGYVLITHNSDHEIGERWLPWIEAVGDKLHHWFAQNVLVPHPKLTPLPIGIANSMWPHGNLGLLHRTMGGVRRVGKTELVYLQFNTKTHPERAHARDVLRSAFSQNSDPDTKPKSFRRYLRDLRRHRFCVCPRGNGIDTHRVWECLYLETIPILIRSAHTQHWEDCRLPVLLVDDWAEVTGERLEQESEHIAIDPRALDHLRVSHYAALVRSELAVSQHEAGPAPAGS